MIASAVAFMLADTGQEALRWIGCIVFLGIACGLGRKQLSFSRVAAAAIVFSFVMGTFWSFDLFVQVSDLEFERTHPGMHQFWQTDLVDTLHANIQQLVGSWLDENIGPQGVFVAARLQCLVHGRSIEN
jgi:hypothetical protein